MAAPLFQATPRQIIRLRVIIAQFYVLATDHLFDLRQRDSVTLRAKRHHALYDKNSVLCYMPTCPKTRHKYIPEHTETPKNCVEFMAA